MRLGIDALRVTAPLGGQPPLPTILRRLARLYVAYLALAVVVGLGIFGVVVLWGSAGSEAVALVVIALLVMNALLIALRFRGRTRAGAVEQDGAVRDSTIRDLQRRIEVAEHALEAAHVETATLRDDLARRDMRIAALGELLARRPEEAAVEPTPAKKQS